MTTAPAPKNDSTRTPTDASRPSARMLVCLVVLATSAIGVQVLPERLGLYLRKQAVPLKQPLQFLDFDRLGPRYERHPDSDEIKISEDAIQSLGTREFLQVYLTDTAVPAAAPTSRVHLFLTYYTGKPDMVPHVPDVCYLAGGWDAVRKDFVDVHIPGVGAPDDTIPVRVIQFRTSQAMQMTSGVSAGVLTVLYFFHTNGKYATTRDEVRLVQTNLFQRYGYFAKIEVTFPQSGTLSADESFDACVRGLEPLLARLMPVLFEDHFDLSHFAPAAESTGSEK